MVYETAPFAIKDFWIEGGEREPETLPLYQRSTWGAHRCRECGMREHEELSEFDTLDVNERAATERALKRCLALADKIARELSKKKPEDFPSTLSLADFQASLERVAEVLEDHPPKK